MSHPVVPAHVNTLTDVFESVTPNTLSDKLQSPNSPPPTLAQMKTQSQTGTTNTLGTTAGSSPHRPLYNTSGLTTGNLNSLNTISENLVSATGAASSEQLLQQQPGQGQAHPADMVDAGTYRRRSRTRSGSFSFHLEDLSEQDSDEDPHENVTYEVTPDMALDENTLNHLVQSEEEIERQEKAALEAQEALKVMHKYVFLLFLLFFFSVFFIRPLRFFFFPGPQTWPISTIAKDLPLRISWINIWKNI
jgi:hypothetical protein